MFCLTSAAVALIHFSSHLSSLEQLLKPKEHHPTSATAYHQHMARLSANPALDRSKISPGGTSHELLHDSDNTSGKELAQVSTGDGGEIGSAALTVTEKHSSETTV